MASDSAIDGVQEKDRRQFGRWQTVVAIGFMATVIAVFEIISLPFRDIENLKGKNPGRTAFMVLQKEEFGRSFHVYQKWIAISAIPRWVLDAVVVAEDGRFWSHDGLDWFEIRESIEQNIREGRAARGASTITQQLVKNLYLSPSKNPLRKVREWILTWWMEYTLSKRRILEIYLNVIEWGRCVYGIEAASETYFGKNAMDLTKEEAARLAAIIPNPRKYRADESSEYVEAKAALILKRMAARGM